MARTKEQERMMRGGRIPQSIWDLSRKNARVKVFIECYLAGHVEYDQMLEQCILNLCQIIEDQNKMILRYELERVQVVYAPVES